jgi:type VI secretion system secreted protein Hcp
MAIYLKYGDDIKGEVTATNYENFLECTTASFSGNRPSGIGSGSGQGKRHTDVASVSDLNISRAVDSASPLLFKECVSGKEITAEVHFTKQDATGQVTWCKLDLTDCLITSYSFNGESSGGSESLTISFVTITMTETKTDAEGAETPVIGSFSLATGKPV